MPLYHTDSAIPVLDGLCWTASLYLGMHLICWICLEISLFGLEFSDYLFCPSNLHQRTRKHRPNLVVGLCDSALL